jgi:hypothetical protein
VSALSHRSFPEDRNVIVDRQHRSRPMIPEVIDALTLAGNRTKVNDDAFGIAGNRVWVIDGATGLGSSLLPGKSDAAWLSRTANRLLHTHHAIRDSEQLIGVVIQGLVSAFADDHIAEAKARWELPVASFLLLTFEENEIEAVWLGDCRAILQIGDAIVACGETPDGEARERAFAAKLANESLGSEKTGPAMLRSDDVIAALREQRAKANTGNGHWLLGLDLKAAFNLQRARFPITGPITGPVTGLAMSDGFSALELKYQRYKTEELLAAAPHKGLMTLAAELRHIEEVEDPDGVQFPRFKRSDDATAVLFDCNPTR